MKAKTILIIVASIILLIGALFGLQYLGLANYKFFAPKYQNAQREVFENTQSFTEGKRQDLIKYYHEWLNADKDGKSAIKELVIDDFASYDINKLTPSEQNMYNSITQQ